MKTITTTLILFMTNLCYAKDTAIIKAIGVGDNRKAAIVEAQKNALEEAVGVYIQARTVVSKSILTEDKIQARSQGRLLSSSVISEKTVGDKYQVEIRAVIDLNGTDFPHRAGRASSMYAALTMVNEKPPTDQELDAAVADPSKTVQAYVQKLTKDLPQVPKAVLLEDIAKQLDIDPEDLNSYLTSKEN